MFKKTNSKIKQPLKWFGFVFFLILLFFNISLVFDESGWSVTLVKDVSALPAGCYTFGQAEAHYCEIEHWYGNSSGAYITCNPGGCICYFNSFCQ